MILLSSTGRSFCKRKMKQYGVVLIGCGHIGKEHISDIYYRDNIRIKAVVDRDIHRAEEFQKRYCAEIADTEYLPYLDREDVDIVIIATPASCHVKMLEDALQRGKHVLCEKPLAPTAEDGQRFYDLCKQSKSYVSVGYILRYNDTFRKVKELIDSGAIGKLKLARMVQNHHIMEMERYHALLRECSPLLDCGVHYFDLLQWISGGSIQAVSGFGTKIEPDFADVAMDYGVANLFLDNGVVGYYEAGWSRSIPSSNVKEFIGEKGSISVTLQPFRGNHTEEGDLIEIYHNDDGRYETINVPCEYKPMYRQLCALIDRIEGRESHAPTIEEAYRAFCVGIAADCAAKTGKQVQIS